ncbi:hypothetical protein [Enhygromyxa salina]|uniref:Sox C-terminal domain-containing protein n=1 Tax=Enhygromyxa salina TaxID=215803 RepID=A0A2S9YTL7_9BACT|nr:hypothetical protein [Enhygromyxa salina]PRQ08433.1 hypothetical protein ENSA7_17180 [Enhygromyxa salina]
MSLLANIDHLAIAAGIEAVVVEATSREYRGDQNWHPVLDGALDLFKRTEEKSIRLVVGSHTIVVQREGGEAVGVVLPTGHAIAKSLRRMIRRMARKNRGPIAKPNKPEQASPTTSPAAGSPATTPPGPGTSQATPPGVGQSTPPSGGQLSVPPAAKPPEENKANSASPQQGQGPQNTDRGSFTGY